MSFESNTGSMPIIDDRNFTDYLDPTVNGKSVRRGHKPRDYNKQPMGSLGGFAKGFDLRLIPRSDWPELIERKEREQSRLVDLCDYHGLTVLNQGRTNYCWINAPVHCLEIVRMVQGQNMVRLSPASVGTKIKNFQNRGGWGSEGLEYLVDHGCVPQEQWPPNAIDRKYDTSENDLLRDRYRVTEWYELQPKNFNQLATCLLYGMPVSVGYNWWGHQVTAMDLVQVRGGFGIIIDNSWGEGWENNGRGVLVESKATPDDAVSPRVAVAS